MDAANDPIQPPFESIEQIARLLVEQAEDSIANPELHP
jgi:hypothetical protein